MTAYKKVYSAAKGEPVSYSYDGQQCTPSVPSSERRCVMTIYGPDRSVFADRKGYETVLNCGTGTNLKDMVCTNRADRYNAQLLATMRKDPRCRAFPRLVSDNLAVSGKVARSNSPANSTEFRDLPASIRYGNDNKDPTCRRAVAKVRKLENDPRFENDRSVRLQWQDAFEATSAMGCRL
jgi:hypothetical protein